jgi:hypothetical protein
VHELEHAPVPKANCTQSGPAAVRAARARSPLRVSGWHVLEAYEPRRWSVVAHSHLGIWSISTCAPIRVDDGSALAVVSPQGRKILEACGERRELTPCMTAIAKNKRPALNLTMILSTDLP